MSAGSYRALNSFTFVGHKNQSVCQSKHVQYLYIYMCSQLPISTCVPSRVDPRGFVFWRALLAFFAECGREGPTKAGVGSSSPFSRLLCTQRTNLTVATRFLHRKVCFQSHILRILQSSEYFIRSRAPIFRVSQYLQPVRPSLTF